MKLAQFRDSDGRQTAAIFDQGRYHPIPNHTVASLIQQSEATNHDLPELAWALASNDTFFFPTPDIPVTPPEVWACGCTYAPSAEFRDAELGGREGMYNYVYRADRPEIFFKGTSRICVGPGESIGIRCDSQFTAPEPELALVIDGQGRIQGYTLGNDVSAWDIERENALYLTQSKVYLGSCALGPVMVTADEIDNPYGLHITCSVLRDGQTIFQGSVSTSQLYRRLEELIEFLMRANPVPAGTVVLTGTGIIVPEEAALRAGDEVRIEVPEIGVLSNPVAVVG